MVRPDGIPEDIWSAAKAAYVPGSVAEPKSKVTLEKIVWIATAILAERERCAKIAEEDVRTALAIDRQYKPTWFVRAEQIAEAIRKGAP